MHCITSVCLHFGDVCAGLLTQLLDGGGGVSLVDDSADIVIGQIALPIRVGSNKLLAELVGVVESGLLKSECPSICVDARVLTPIRVSLSFVTGALAFWIDSWYLQMVDCDLCAHCFDFSRKQAFKSRDVVWEVGVHPRRGVLRAMGCCDIRRSLDCEL